MSYQKKSGLGQKTLIKCLQIGAIVLVINLLGILLLPRKTQGTTTSSTDIVQENSFKEVEGMFKWHYKTERNKERIAMIVESRKTVATVTAYNTVEAQSDSSPCQAAGGYICGRTDVVACPRILPLGTWVQIEGMGRYECMDRTAAKFGDRYDISFDKDIQAAKQFGKRQLNVSVL